MRGLRVIRCSPRWGAVLFWAVFAACLDTPGAPGSAVARLVVAWDPLACGAPHRVAVELDDEADVRVSASTPCSLGAVTVDVAHTGAYHGRVYAWAIGEPVRSVTPLEVVIDQAVVRRQVATPP